jgi:GTP-binding protein
VKFVDSCHVDLIAGRGGNGAIAFRREKFVPFGGPSGGDGGRGADIVFVADEGLSTLVDLTYGRTLRGDHGEHGQGADCYGRAAKELAMRVPVGTQVYDRDTDELLFDIDQPHVRVVVAKGGKGGRGNIHFSTPYDRAPRRAEPGEPGEERRLRLELKVMADVGLLGFPNVGKSTFIRAVSRAQPKVADYPFTTLTPHLGVVRVGDEATFVVADIPGLIPGAAEGAGLGHRFLKHVERCRALLHLVTLDPAEGREPLADYEALQHELLQFDPELAKRPQIVALSKADVTEVREAYEELRAKFAKKNVDLQLISAATNAGITDLTRALYKLVNGRPAEDWEAQPAKAATATTVSVDKPVTTKGPTVAKTSATKSVPAKKKPAYETAAKPKDNPVPATKKTATKLQPTAATAKKAGTKKIAAKPAIAKKIVAKKTAAKPAIAKKNVAKKTAAKPANAKKATAKKTAVKPAIAKKIVAKKTAAKPAIAKKLVAKKTTTKPAIAKKSVAKKTAAKPAIAKKAVAKKTATKPTNAKKVGAKKVANTAKLGTKKTAGKPRR